MPAVNLVNGVFRLPKGIGYDEAVFIEPLACTLRGQRRTGVGPGDTLAVLGAGLTGLLHVRLARALGAARVIATDVLPARREAALRSGADAALDALGDVAAGIREHNGGRLADVVIVATGAPPALRQALECVDRGGSVLFFAPTDPGYELPLPFNRIWGDEVTLHTSYGASPRDIETAMRHMSEGRVRVLDLITHRLPLSSIQEGFRLVAGPVDSLKVVIEPQR